MRFPVSSAFVFYLVFVSLLFPVSVSNPTTAGNSGTLGIEERQKISANWETNYSRIESVKVTRKAETWPFL